MGRQVQDGSYFIGVLRGKMNDTRAEIGRLRAEIEQHEKDVSQQTHLERMYDTRLQDVKMLEGDLADYNLAVDKARTTADPGEVAKYLHDLEDHNRCVFFFLFLYVNQSIEGDQCVMGRRLAPKIYYVFLVHARLGSRGPACASFSSLGDVFQRPSSMMRQT